MKDWVNYLPDCPKIHFLIIRATISHNKGHPIIRAPFSGDKSGPNHEGGVYQILPLRYWPFLPTVLSFNCQFYTLSWNGFLNSLRNKSAFLNFFQDGRFLWKTCPQNSRKMDTLRQFPQSGRFFRESKTCVLEVRTEIGTLNCFWPIILHFLLDF